MTYKNILWVDDFDVNDGGDGYRSRHKPLSESNRLSQIQNAFPEKYVSCVEVKESLESAIEAIEHNISNYDCAVLDVRLWYDGQKKENQRIPMDRLRSGCVNLEGMNDKEILENAGYYIYLYLLHKGFPCDRILMRTAFGEEHEVRDKFKGAKILPPDTYSKQTNLNDAGKSFSDTMDALYTNGNHYYKVRQLIFAACSFYEEQMANLDGIAPISYNDILYLGPGEESRKLSCDDIINLLDNIKRQFPQHVPLDIQKCYLGTLRIISAPFDMKHDNGKVKVRKDDTPEEKGKKNSLRTFWDVMRLLRNWTAHGKFEKKVTEADFLLLFMTALRAYFADMGAYGIKEYEKNIFKCEYISFLTKDVSKIKLEDVRKNVQKLYMKRFNEFSYRKVFTVRYTDILEALGNDNAYEGAYKRLLELICLAPNGGNMEMQLSDEGKLNIVWEIRDNKLEEILGLINTEEDFLAKVRNTCYKLDYI